MRKSVDEITKTLEERENRTDFKQINTFRISKDGDKKKVLPLFDKAEDTEFYSVHAVKMVSPKSGKEYTVDVDCIGTGCPFCREAPKYAEVKFPAIPQISRKQDTLFMNFVTVTLNDKGEYEFEYTPWKRSAYFYKSTLQQASAYYSPMMGNPLDIVRVDKKTYNFFPARADEQGNPYPKFNMQEIKTNLNIVPEDIYGRPDSLVKSWTVDQMEEYIANPNTYPSFQSEGNDEVKEEVKEERPTAPTSPRSRNGRGF